MNSPAPPPWLPQFQLTAPPAGFADDPYPFYDALRAHAPLHRLAPDAVLLTRHDDVLAVYRSGLARSDKRREFAPRLGEGSPIYEHHTSSLVFNDPPLHTRVRRILTGALSQRVVAGMEAGLVTLVDALLDRLMALPAPDLIEDFAARIPVEVIGNLLDMPHSERAPLRDWSLAILSALEPAPSAALLARANSAVTDFLACLRSLVAHRRRHPGDPQTDVLTRLLQAESDGESEGDGQLSETELLHNCIFLLNAGHETTTNLIGNGMHALLTHTDQWHLLRAEPALLPQAVEELLRFESPLQLNNRLAGADLQLPSGLVEAGCFVTLAVGAANRDPAVFERPQQLDITRRPKPHLAFGQGAHACSGMNVARLEARIAIGRLLARCPGLALAGPPLRDPRLRFRGLQRLPVRCRA